jgi:hypothetical protein
LSKHSLGKTAPSIGLPSVQRHALVREFLFVEALKRVDIALPSCDDEAAGMTAVASSFEGDPAIVSGMKSGDTS